MFYSLHESEKEESKRDGERNIGNDEGGRCGGRSECSSLLDLNAISLSHSNDTFEYHLISSDV